jgi:uncharacterized membrane protein YkvA (DUF1232 family)
MIGAKTSGRFHVILRVVVAVAGAMLVAWLALVVFLLVRRPEEGTSREALRLLPDTVRLLRRIAADRSLPRGVRVRLWLLLAYLLFPLDLVPDFIPMIGYADDIVIATAALRSVVRRAGPRAVRRHWPGSDDGLAALWRVAGLPGEPTSA